MRRLPDRDFDDFHSEVREMHKGMFKLFFRFGILAIAFYIAFFAVIALIIKILFF